MLLPRCSPKQLTWLFLCLSIAVMFNLWYMTHLFKMKFMFDRLQDNLSVNHKPINRILLWNSFDKLAGLDIECPDYNCVFDARTPSINFENISIILYNEEVLNSTDRPKKRWGDLIYIFWSLTPPDEAPACGVRNDNFFNWTFTFRLDSTLVWNHFLVEHLNTTKIVAPDERVKWEVSHDPVKPHVQSILNKKTKALAWVKTVCNRTTPGDTYMVALQLDIAELGLYVDVFDECTPQEDRHGYWNVINEKEYYFLIAFEDYFAKDYITDKVLRAYNNYAVPIVYGGANYSWFLPPGSYVDAKTTSPFNLAYIIKQAVQKPSFYETFFNWTNVYNISAYPPGEHPLCNLCTVLNNDDVKEHVSDFRRWWNTPKGQKACNETAAN